MALLSLAETVTMPNCDCTMIVAVKLNNVHWIYIIHVNNTVFCASILTLLHPHWKEILSSDVIRRWQSTVSPALIFVVVISSQNC